MLEKSESYLIKKSKHPLKDVCFLLPLHVCKRHSCIHLAYELIFMFTHISLSGKQWVNRLFLFAPVCAVSWSIFTVLDGNIQKKVTDNQSITVICHFYKGDPVGIRTRDPQLRRLLLYPAELPDHHLYYWIINLFSA